MKKIYKIPEIELKFFTIENVMTVSSGTLGDGVAYDIWQNGGLDL